MIQKQKDYFSKKLDWVNNNQNIYSKQNRIKINLYEKKEEIDINFCLIKNKRCRIHHALISKRKSSSTLNILGINVDTCRKRIEFQFTPEMNWSKNEIDQVKPVYLLDVSKDDELRQGFCWKNIQPLLKKIHSQKGTNFNFYFLVYQLKFIKAYQFISLNEEKIY